MNDSMTHFEREVVQEKTLKKNEILFLRTAPPKWADPAGDCLTPWNPY